jgi:hypothetical protein
MLSCRCAQLNGCDSDGYSLAAYGIHVTDDVSLDQESTANGEIREFIANGGISRLIRFVVRAAPGRLAVRSDLLVR